jgi:hypothetical protein
MPDPETLAKQLTRPRRGLPPVLEWDPPYRGEIDLRIARDGGWHYQGSPIRRHALVRLFASVLRRDDDGHHYLVTPVERVRIQVEDAPFVAVAMEVSGRDDARCIAFVTNVGDRTLADAAHPVTMRERNGEMVPYVLVRDRLEARIGRAVYFDLAELGTVRPGRDLLEFGVWSSGCFFPLGRLDAS